MLKGDFLFIYGTLRQGERSDLRKQAHNFEVDFISRDKINGRMYHIGSFPGVKDVSLRFDDMGPIVVGEVFRLRSQAIIAILDAYEGYDADNPSQGLFDRCQVHTERGRLAWVYIYNARVRSEQLIESGDWCRNRQTLVSGRQLLAP